MDKSNSHDIINAAAKEGIFDTTLGLSEKERRSAIAGKGHVASKIMFGEAKEGAVKAHNFSSSASITTIHSKNVNDSKSVASQKILAKSVFSLATSWVTSDGSEEEEMDEDKDSDFDGSATKPSGVEIEGMQMLTKEQEQHKWAGRRVRGKHTRICTRGRSTTYKEHEQSHGTAETVVGRRRTGHGRG